MIYRLTLLVLIFGLALAGCGGAVPATQATPTTSGYPVVVPTSGDTGYPSGPQTPAAEPTTGYPGPGSAPAVESRAQVTVELVEQSVDPADAARVRLRVKLLSASPLNGTPDRLSALVGQEIDLYAPAEGLPALAPGDQFSAEAVFRGDENGSIYTAENIQK